MVNKTLAITAFRRSGNADFARTYHHVTVPHDVTLDDIMRPGFWAHHATTLRKNDILDILTEDDSLDVQVRVTGVGIGMVFMRLLRDDPRRLVERPAPEQGRNIVTDDDVPEGYLVNFAPKHGHRVIFKETGMIISKDHKSRADALAKAIEHNAAANTPAAA